MYPDLSQISNYSQAGIAGVQYALNDPGSGLPMGPTGTISAGQSRGFSRYIAIKQFSDATPAPRPVNVTGDNGNFIQQYLFNPAELGLINATFGTMDQDAFTRWTNTKIEALGDINIVGGQTNIQANARQISLLVTSDAQNAASSYFGQPTYNSFFYPAVNMYLAAKTLTEAAAMDWPYQGSPTQVARKPWGPLATLATNGFTRSKFLQLSTRNPPTMQTAVSNGSQTVWALDATPDSDQTGYTFFVFRYQSTGTVTQITPTVITPGNRSVTLPIAGTSGDFFLMLYTSWDVLSQ